MVTSTSVTVPSLEWETGDYLILSVFHRSALTIPDGYTLINSAGPHASDANNQVTSVLYRIVEETGSGTQVVQQASSGRIAAAIIVLRGVTGISALTEFNQVINDNVAGVTTPPKPTNNMVIWSISRVVWSTDATAVLPWMANPGLLQVSWPTAVTTQAPRLGVFIDKVTPISRDLNGQGGISTDAKLLAPIELVGTTRPFRGDQGEIGLQGPTGVGVPVIWQGAWDEVTEYAQQDGVHYEGSSYVSKANANTNHLPTDVNWWHLIAEKGEQGEIGPIGPDGEQGMQGEIGPTGPAQPRPTDIQYYADGFIVTFADESIGNYSWVKDGDGQITNITNTTPDPDEILNIGYHSGNRP